jgi:hypothetical protein
VSGGNWRNKLIELTQENIERVEVHALCPNGTKKVCTDTSLEFKDNHIIRVRHHELSFYDQIGRWVVVAKVYLKDGMVYINQPRSIMIYNVK